MIVVTVVVLSSVRLLSPPFSISHTHRTDSQTLSTPLWLCFVYFHFRVLTRNTPLVLMLVLLSLTFLGVISVVSGEYWVSSGQ